MKIHYCQSFMIMTQCMVVVESIKVEIKGPMVASDAISTSFSQSSDPVSAVPAEPNMNIPIEIP